MKTNRSQQTAVTGERGQQFSLRNDFGFWELTFNGRRAVVPQHQALFYVACLLANPSAEPIPGRLLAAKVFDRFAQHPDFDLSTLQLHRDQADLAAILLAKQRALIATLDRDDLEQIIKDEAERELLLVQEFQSTLRAETAQTADQTAAQILLSLRDLYNTLAFAVDLAGNPHPVLRPFAIYLLWHIMIPATRSTVGGRPPTFTYQPHPELLWRA